MPSSPTEEHLLTAEEASPNFHGAASQTPRKQQFFKTKMCPWYFKGRCDRGKSCQFAHSHAELRDAPDLSCTSLCPNIRRSGTCNSATCKYAHTSAELRATGEMFKTALCVKWLVGRCNAGIHCRHAHGTDELRKEDVALYHSSFCSVPGGGGNYSMFCSLPQQSFTPKSRQPTLDSPTSASVGSDGVATRSPPGRHSAPPRNPRHQGGAGRRPLSDFLQRPLLAGVGTQEIGGTGGTCPGRRANGLASAVSTPRAHSGARKHQNAGRINQRAAGLTTIRGIVRNAASAVERLGNIPPPQETASPCPPSVSTSTSSEISPDIIDSLTSPMHPPTASDSINSNYSTYLPFGVGSPSMGYSSLPPSSFSKPSLPPLEPAAGLLQYVSSTSFLDKVGGQEDRFQKGYGLGNESLKRETDSAVDAESQCSVLFNGPNLWGGMRMLA